MAKVKNVWVKKWTVTSFTDSSISYTVSQAKDGHYGCSCPAWRFKKADLTTGLRPDCKHILATAGKVAEKMLQKINEETRALLDLWAVEEVYTMPDLDMTPMYDRTI